MSELKPCPFCGGEAVDSFRGVGCGDDFCPGVHVRCSESEWNTRPAPELPEGYWEDAPVGFSNRLQYHHKSEVAGEFWITIAVWLYEEDKISIMKPLNPKHAHALAIWLQRGAR